MLNIDPVVKVNVQVGTSMVSEGTFDVGMILTPTAGTITPLTKDTRFAVYDSLTEILTGVSGAKPAFGTDSDVYKAAAKYFGVENAPSKVVVVYYETDPDADPYDSSKPYAVGDYCTNQDKTWTCTTAIETGEAWNASHWAEVPPTSDTPVIAMLDAIEKKAEFYGVYYSPKSTESDTKAQIMAIVSALNSLNKGVLFYGVSGDVASVISANSVMNDLFAVKAKRAVGMYCTSELDDAAGLMGTAMGLAGRYKNQAFALCYKGIASATSNLLTQTEVNAIKAIQGNVFVQRTRNRTCVENGATASGLRFDDVLFIDKLVYEVQNGLYELISGSATKYPQNDSTSAVFCNELFTIIDKYYTMGVITDSVWRGQAIMGVEPGDMIEHGHTELVESFDLQSDEDRAAHKAMPITVLLCLAGSVESIVISIDVQT